MTAPNMAAITASLERSLQSFSLNHHSNTTTTTAAVPDSPNTHFQRSTNSSDATLELNSNITLPYHWEQCLDLKTGEMYYINWRTGMRSKEDPRTVDDGFSGYYYSDDDEEAEESSYADSDGSSVESSAAASSSRKQKQIEDDDDDDDEEEEEEEEEEESSRIGGGGGHVLVVAGCKGCFMYFMVPKQVEDCPKCCGQLIHFDRSDDN